MKRKQESETRNAAMQPKSSPYTPEELNKLMYGVFAALRSETAPEECSHDCATGIGTTPWSGTIWECDECHAVGEDRVDHTAIVWTPGVGFRKS